MSFRSAAQNLKLLTICPFHRRPCAKDGEFDKMAPNVWGFSLGHQIFSGTAVSELRHPLGRALERLRKYLAGSFLDPMIPIFP
mmetsp:Transcript_39551/g.91424  ORF Transcript_39551/g.91424 Transcript_39551/m.91424 type:complete len:83 (-) Transcript_39551:421-669(-)